MLVQNSNEPVKASIFYINDFHAKIPNLERLYSASRSFDSFESSSDRLKLSSGDNNLGEDKLTNKVVSKFLDMVGITKTQAGNHEFDIDTASHAENLKGMKCQELGAVNIHINPQNCLNKLMISSAIEEHNGHKYGIVGVGPSDMLKRVKTGDSSNNLTVDDLNQTIVNLQKEVDKFKSQGINKIILLSHSGYANDIYMAKHTSDIDIILGGHSHDLLQGVEMNKNLFYNKNNEPVVITQAGKDGEHFGILNVEFNNDGILTKAYNNIIDTKNFSRTLVGKYAVDSILGKPQDVGVINSVAPAPQNRLVEHNPHGCFIADAMRFETGSDIALLNSANIRGNFEKGKINSRMISEITPFKNRMMITNITEKELVEAIKLGGLSFKTKDNKPGIMLVSGLRYTMNKNGELLKLSYLDKNNTEIPIDINNPNPNKTYKVCMDDFIGTGGDGYTMLDKMKQAEKIYDYDKDVLTCQYIKKLNKPIDIIDDKRINIV